MHSESIKFREELDMPLDTSNTFQDSDASVKLIPGSKSFDDAAKTAANKMFYDLQDPFPNKDTKSFNDFKSVVQDSIFNGTFSEAIKKLNGLGGGNLKAAEQPTQPVVTTPDKMQIANKVYFIDTNGYESVNINETVIKNNGSKDNVVLNIHSEQHSCY